MKSINHRIPGWLLAGALGGFAAAAATAASLPDFKSADSNGDGKVSQAEFTAKGGSDQTFREADANRDSSLSSEEYTKAVSGMAAPKSEKPKPGY